MHRLTLREVPDQVYQALKRNAALNHRSLNKEVIFELEKSLSTRALTPERILAGAARSRELVKDKKFRLTDENLKQIKDQGRP